MKNSARCASLCAAAALATTWAETASAGAVQTTDTFELGVHFLAPGATLYNARFLYYGHSSPGGPKSVAYLGNLTEGSLTTISVQRPPFQFDFMGSTVTIEGYDFALVGSYLPAAAGTETGIALGNGRDFVAVGASFAALFGANPTENSLVTDILASSNSDTTALNNFFDSAKQGATEVGLNKSNGNGPLIGNGLSFNLYNFSDPAAAGSFTLSPVGAPETGTWATLGLAALVVARWSVRRRA